MQELIVAVLSAGVGILILRAFDKYGIDKHQKELDEKVSDNDKNQARLEGEQAHEDKQTQEKVDDIEKEKNDKPTGSSLSDWFNRRK